MELWLICRYVQSVTEMNNDRLFLNGDIKSEKKFWYYFNYTGYPVINEIVEPVCPYEEEYHTSFLVYAENEEMAFKLAMEHIYEWSKMDKFYGTYKGEKYSSVACIM